MSDGQLKLGDIVAVEFQNGGEIHGVVREKPFCSQHRGQKGQCDCTPDTVQIETNKLTSIRVPLSRVVLIKN